MTDPKQGEPEPDRREGQRGAPMPWFRLYSRILESRSLRMAATRCKLERPLAVGYLTGLLCLASEAELRGYLEASGTPLTIEDITSALYGKPEEVQPFIEELVKLRTLAFDEQRGSYYFLNWSGYNPISDNGADRQRKWRAEAAAREAARQAEREAADALMLNSDNAIPDQTSTRPDYTILEQTARVTSLSRDSNVTPEPEPGASAPGANTIPSNGGTQEAELPGQAAMAYMEAIKHALTQEEVHAINEAIPEPTEEELMVWNLRLEAWKKNGRGATHNVKEVLKWHRLGLSWPL